MEQQIKTQRSGTRNCSNKVMMLTSYIYPASLSSHHHLTPPHLFISSFSSGDNHLWHLQLWCLSPLLGRGYQQILLLFQLWLMTSPLLPSSSSAMMAAIFTRWVCDEVSYVSCDWRLLLYFLLPHGSCCLWSDVTIINFTTSFLLRWDWWWLSYLNHETVMASVFLHHMRLCC